MCDLCVPAHLTRRQLLRLGAAAALAPALATATEASAEDLEITVAPGLTIKRRAAWAGPSEPPKGEVPLEEVRFLLVHHTADRFEHEKDDVPAILRGYYGFHTSDEKGWPDIAYNFMIDRFGQVWETHAGSVERPLRGYATGGNQGFSQLVCLIGDFTNAMPTEEALDALTKTLAWLAERDGIDTQPGATATFISRGSNRHPVGTEVTTPTINGHRSMSTTSCPGDAFFPYVRDTLPAQVSAHRGSVTTPSTGSTTTAAPVEESSTITSATVSTTSVPDPTSAAPVTSATTDTAAPRPLEESAVAPVGTGDPSASRGLLAFGAVGTVATAAFAAVAYRRAQNAYDASARPDG